MCHEKSTIEGHRSALKNEENTEWISGLMPFLLGVFFFGKSAFQPAQRAEELTDSGWCGVRVLLMRFWSFEEGQIEGSQVKGAFQVCEDRYINK